MRDKKVNRVICFLMRRLGMGGAGGMDGCLGPVLPSRRGEIFSFGWIRGGGFVKGENQSRCCTRVYDYQGTGHGAPWYCKRTPVLSRHERYIEVWVFRPEIHTYI